MFFGTQTALESFFKGLAHLFRVVLFAGFTLTAGGNTVELTILASADLHGNPEQIRKAVAPAVKSIFQQAPGRTIYVDAGDCAQGSLKILRSRGMGILPELYRANCTIFVPGNHELEFGFDAFKNIIRDFPGTVLAANLYAPELDGSFKDHVIVEMSGVKVAFIGLMLKNMQYAFPVEETRFRTLPGAAVLRRSVNRALAAKADVIILVRHAGKYGGGENTYDLVKHVPETDLVIGAHTHQPDAGSTVGNSWYVQPPAHGKALVKVNIFFDRKLKRVKQIKSSLLPLPQYRENTPEELEAAPAIVGKTLDYPAEKIAEKFNTDLALYAVSSPAKLQSLLQKTAPTQGDYYEVFPYFDPIITVTVSAGEFKVIAAEYSKFLRKRKQYLAKKGFQVNMVRSRVRSVTLEKSQNSYTLALSSYAAAGAGGYLENTRRILSKKINHKQARNAPGILEVLSGK